MKNDKISVIVPVYKAEAFLDRCINSLVGQSHKNIEIILVDDESPDNCPAICDKWAKQDNRIKVIHKENDGVNKARLAGIKAAGGSYIAFVDSDDWVKADTYEYLLKLINSGEYQVACCGYELVYDDNEPDEEAEESITELDFPAMIKGLYDYSLWSVCFKLFKKELFDNSQCPANNLTVSEDLLQNYFIFKQCDKIIVSNKKKYMYFRHPQSVMAVDISERRIRDQLTAYRMISEDFDSGSPAFCYQAANRLQNDFSLLNQVIKNNQSKKYRKLIREDIILCKKFIFKKENNYCFSLKHKLAFIVLYIAPPIYNIIAKHI